MDYSHGHTGSAHDATAFEGTCAAKHPEYLFSGDEFSWVDSAYPLTRYTLPVHKRPAALLPENIAFDKVASHIRVRSEHCMGALKGRFQCLRGLRVDINNVNDHIEALRWITVAIILHNLFIDTEGPNAHDPNEIFQEDMEAEAPGQGAARRAAEGPIAGEVLNEVELEGEAKRRRITEEILAFRNL